MYLFSYIMYEYRMTQGNPSSFVIINQDVEYLLGELQKSDYAESTSADFFLLSKEFGACGSVKNIAEEDIDRFTQAFCSSKDQSVGSGSLTLNIEGKNFFVSYITLPKTDVDVVIIQPKNIVFSTLTDWHTAVRQKNTNHEKQSSKKERLWRVCHRRSFVIFYFQIIVPADTAQCMRKSPAAAGLFRQTEPGSFALQKRPALSI